MNQGGIAVVGKDHRPFIREQGVELGIRHPVGVLLRWFQSHQVDHVDHPDFQIGKLLSEDGGRGDSLQGRDIATASEHHVRLKSVI